MSTTSDLGSVRLLGGRAEDHTFTLAAELRAWLASGDVQSQSGAFYAWLDASTGLPAFEYPEITGYALTHLAGLSDPTVDEIDAGRRAGDWLQRRIHRGEFSARDDWDGGAVYNFDLAMMSNGLLTFGGRFDVGDFVDAGLVLARRLADQALDRRELAALPVGATSSRSVWSTDGRALMVKATQCLLSASDFKPSAPYAEAAAIVAGMAAQIQLDDGRMMTHPADVETMCHPHLYAVEGLWVYGTATGDSDALQRARAGAEWVLMHQLESGGFPRFVHTSTQTLGPEQFDVTSQALRAGLLAGADRSESGILAAGTRLAEVAVGTGGLSALPYQNDGPHLNTWVSLFGFQTTNIVVSSEYPSWRALV